MKYPAFFIVLFVAIPSLKAETPYEREFRQLKEQRVKAIADATAQIDRNYGKSLEPLLVRASQATQVELAMEIKKELQSLKDAAVASNPNPLAGHWQGVIDKKEPTDFTIFADGNARLNIRPGKCVKERNNYFIQWDNGVVWRLPLAPTGNVLEFEQRGPDESKWTKAIATRQQ